MVDEPANDAGRVRAGQGHRRGARSPCHRREVIDCGEERGVGEAGGGIDQEGGVSADPDRRPRRASDLAAPQVLAIRREVGEADVAQVLGFGLTDGIGDRLGVGWAGPRPDEGAAAEVVDVVKGQMGHDQESYSGTAATGTTSTSSASSGTASTGMRAYMCVGWSVQYGLSSKPQSS